MGGPRATVESRTPGLAAVSLAPALVDLRIRLVRSRLSSRRPCGGTRHGEIADFDRAGGGVCGLGSGATGLDAHHHRRAPVGREGCCRDELPRYVPAALRSTAPEHGTGRRWWWRRGG